MKRPQKKKKKSIKITDEDKISEKVMVKGAKLEDSILKKVYSFLHLHIDTLHQKY